MTHDLRILQAARLKGRPTEAALAAAAGLAEADASAVVESLIAADLLNRAGARLKLTPEGRARLETMLAAERDGVDTQQLKQRYDEFDDVNSAYKQLVTDWQLIDGSRPNDHSDAAYDARIMVRLGDIHARFTPLLERFVALAPRLEPYPDRFSHALEQIRSGEHKWFALPLIDSYHTVWFELHEDLIGLAGLSRLEEAVAGRAE